MCRVRASSYSRVASFPLICAALAASIICSTTQAQGIFLPEGGVNIPVPGGGTGFWNSGDVDGDGDVDLVLGAPGANLVLFKNDGSGRFFSSSYLPQIRTGWLVYAKLGDLDGDGDPDIVCTVGGLDNQGYPREPVIYENDGKGGFVLSTKMRLPKIGHDLLGLALGDVNGDGSLDIVFGTVVAYPVKVQKAGPNRLLLNNGKGVFVELVNLPASENNCFAIDLADFNGDGVLDVAVANGMYQQDELYLSSRSGGYVASAQLFHFDYSTDIRFLDFEKDGDLDLVVGTIDDGVRLYKNDGKGKLTAMPKVTTIKYTSGVDTGDYNGDGYDDVVVSSTSLFKSVVVLLRNDGKGGFTDSTSQDLRSPYLAIGSGSILRDLDMDGDLDIVGSQNTIAHPSAKKAVFILRNYTRQIVGVPIAAIGKPYQVELAGRAGQVMSLAPALKPAMIPLGSWGTLLVDPQSMVVLPGVKITNHLISKWITFNVPNDLNLVGLHVYFQALDVPSNIGQTPRFTNRVHIQLVR